MKVSVLRSPSLFNPRFWLPELARKIDMIPGHPNRLWLRVAVTVAADRQNSKKSRLMQCLFELRSYLSGAGDESGRLGNLLT